MTDRSADVTRGQILCAAAGQFAVRPYSVVSLDDILGEAQVTKGAMYFHFRSKYALALAIVEQQDAQRQAVVHDIIDRGLSGLETAIDLTFGIAVVESTSEMARAAMHLLESIGRPEGLMEGAWRQWVDTIGELITRAIDEGDVGSDVAPGELARLLVAMYAGARQLTDLAAPRELIRSMENSWSLLIPGIAVADRSDYFRTFVRRRARLAVRDTAAGA